jgi:hypothetical protein
MKNCRILFSSFVTQAGSHTRIGERMVVEGSSSASMLYEAIETHVDSVNLPGQCQIGLVEANEQYCIR